MSSMGRRFTRIRISQTIEAPLQGVWKELRQIDRHVLWMKDAVSITFTTEQHEGPGTAFICKTKIGPFRTNDTMTITEWIEGRQITVHHQGLITGAGRFSLRGEHGRHCVLRWEERLEFPWWLGGSLAGIVAKPILKQIWIRNLDRFSELVLSGIERSAADNRIGEDPQNPDGE